MDENEALDIKSMSLDELEEVMLDLGEKKFRAGQLFSWLHEKQVTSYDEMTNLSGALRGKLAEQFPIKRLNMVERQISKEDGTRKYAFELEDGHIIESVLMKYQYGYSICISSQVGCRMGCKFCASTLDGLARNLAASEMCEQVYAVQRDIGERIGHLVIMGTGEPLDNYDNLIRFLGLISYEKGQNLGARNITVSTCGIVPRIKELADLHLQITLALSLHGATQEKRQALMPVANKYELSEVIEACDYYFNETGRRMTYEYSLVAGQNDSAEDAANLVKLLGGKGAHVNLIPVNPVVERGMKAPAYEACLEFKNRLEKKGIHVTIRREMGRDIDGACGQLRLKLKKAP